VVGDVRQRIALATYFELFLRILNGIPERAPILRYASDLQIVDNKFGYRIAILSAL